MFDMYEDEVRLNKEGLQLPREFISPYQDFRYYRSSVQPEVRLGMNVIKPVTPGYMLVQLHGWHMSMPMPERRMEPLAGNGYLLVQVDMRGRAFSGGSADCNGWELVDIADALAFVRKQYGSYLLDPEIVYLEGGSGGGGNVLAMVGKFPDLFAAATALYGISDYALWYRQDAAGEFRDEMDVWIGCGPDEDAARYRARSGLHLAANLLTPLYMAHGDADERVPVEHTRLYKAQLVALGKLSLLQCDELAGVGGRGHLDGSTEEQRSLIAGGSEANRRQHRRPLLVPDSGRFVVGGYLVTKRFRVTLESVDAVALLSYDLPQGRFTLYAEHPYAYEVVFADGQPALRGVCEAGVPADGGPPVSVR